MTVTEAGRLSETKLLTFCLILFIAACSAMAENCTKVTTNQLFTKQLFDKVQEVLAGVANHTGKPATPSLCVACYSAGSAAE